MQSIDRTQDVILFSLPGIGAAELGQLLVRVNPEHQLEFIQPESTDDLVERLQCPAQTESKSRFWIVPYGTDEFCTEQSELRAIVDWAVQYNCRTIHLVSNNALNVLTGRFGDAVASDFDSDRVVSLLKNIANSMESMRKLLCPTNALEIVSEKFIDKNGRVSKTVTREIDAFLQMNPNDWPASVNNDSVNVVDETTNQRIKKHLRPTLVRAGLGHLINLPRAA